MAWRASEEDFVKNWGVFSNLKVRAGYGVTGNERIGDYASYALVSTNHVTLDGSNNMPGTHLNQSSPENASLKWETTTQYNVGFDMGFFVCYFRWLLEKNKRFVTESFLTLLYRFYFRSAECW